MVFVLKNRVNNPADFGTGSRPASPQLRVQDMIKSMQPVQGTKNMSKSPKYKLVIFKANFLNKDRLNIQTNISIVLRFQNLIPNWHCLLNDLANYDVFRTIRLVRMLRILKLSRYSRGFRILGLTLVRSTRVLFLLVCFQVIK